MASIGLPSITILRKLRREIGAILLPYFDEEIVPKVLRPGLRRFDLKEGDIAANCRALIEAQMI